MKSVASQPTLISVSHVMSTIHHDRPLEVKIASVKDLKTGGIGRWISSANYSASSSRSCQDRNVRSDHAPGAWYRSDKVEKYEIARRLVLASCITLRLSNALVEHKLALRACAVGRSHCYRSGLARIGSYNARSSASG
jgi:hypothetical protein